MVDERKAREIALFRQGKFRDVKLAKQRAAKLENMFEQMGEGELKTCLSSSKPTYRVRRKLWFQSLVKLSTTKCAYKFIACSGWWYFQIDVNGGGSKAVIIGFNTRADASAYGWPKPVASIFATTTSFYERGGRSRSSFVWHVGSRKTEASDWYGRNSAKSSRYRKLVRLPVAWSQKVWSNVRLPSACCATTW